MELVKVPQEIRSCQNLVNGKWQAATGKSFIDVTSPYTGTKVAQVVISGVDDVEQVVLSAQTAFAQWRNTPIKERSQYLFKYRQLILENLDQLSNIAALEAGKTVAEAKAGILKGVEVLEFALSLQNMAQGEQMEVSRGVVCASQREPLGVVAGICPFNFPAMVPMWMYPIALALGNCFILKPSEKVPLTSSYMGELIIQAGFPAGVFSILNGNKESTEHLIKHPLVKAVAFVGSTPVARSIYTLATGLGKRALCLGGAKNALIVVPDADLNLTAKGVLDSFTGCAGQRCMAASLLLAVGNVEPIIQKITQLASELKPGNCLGAIIDRNAHKKISEIIGRAENHGAKILLDGRKAAAPKSYENGNWLGPTIIDQANFEMECVQTEIFGPVLSIMRVASLTEAMQIEAKLNYGNATSIFTTNPAVAKTVSDQATAAMIGINIGVPVPREPFSFGGTKQSKFGQGDITGLSSLEFWTNLKKITSKWQASNDNNWMS